MNNIFIIHWAYGNPNENWFPWLKIELEKLNCKVFVPKFPTPENQTLENWKKIFEDYKQYINENTIVVGHSLAPAFLLDLLENINSPIKSAFFVSGFIELLWNSDFDPINKSFVDRDFDWKTIKQNCDNFHIYHSDNDPYVPLESAKKVANKLDTSLIEVPNAGHFNTTSGYDKFELLLDEIKKHL